MNKTGFRHALKCRVAVTSAFVALSALVGAPAASAEPANAAGDVGVANFTSYLQEVYWGFQSRRWDDQSYSEIRFTGCWTTRDREPPTATIELRQDRSFQPDVSWGERTYIWCFEGPGYSSTHTWGGLASGSHFFQLNLMTPDPYEPLWVDEVHVDTTRED